MRRILGFGLLLLFFCFYFGCSDNDIQQVKANHKDYIEWWLYNHGDYTDLQGKDDFRVQWAQAVFERVKNAADKTGNRPPRLFIIASSIKAYSLVLPDGGIVISPETLNICYHSVKKDEGDTRLAFILGHELAHLSHDDYIHAESFQAMSPEGVRAMGKELKREVTANGEKLKELMADKKGALFAAMAGYPIGRLFSGSNNFLKLWAQRNGVDYACDDLDSHPSFEKRLSFIRPQLLNIAGHLELFRAGVLLFAADSWSDSASAFREFGKLYPSREVWNNLGLCYMRLALFQLYRRFSDDYYRFRLSTAVDYATTAESLEPRGPEDYLKDKEIVGNLDKAKMYLENAADLDCHDRACRLNLATVYILRKEYSHAQAVCDQILGENPHDADGLNNKAIAFYYYGKIECLDTTQKAIQVLERARELDPRNYKVLYNLAYLKQLRNRKSAALRTWKEYLDGSGTPRDDFYIFAYRRLYGSPPPELDEKFVKRETPKLPGGLELGEDFSILPPGWMDAEIRPFKLGLDDEAGKKDWLMDLQVLVNGEIRALVQDQVLEIVEQELSSDKYLGVEDYLNKLGPPQKIIRHTHGNYYVYKELGFSFNEVDGWVHSQVWFEQGL